MEDILTKIGFLDREKWPKRPYCTEDLEDGLKIRSLASALKHPYIQPNPPHLRVWLVFDVDREGAAYAWERSDKPDLPHPSWAAINGENAHAHLAWGLKAPVLIDSPDLRQRPLRYLCAIEAAYRDILGADRGYSGLITKNPASARWKLLLGYRADYSLEELAEDVELKKFTPRHNPEEVGLGRNVTVFEWLRRLAYRNIRRYKPSSGQGCIEVWNGWMNYCNTRALERNGEFRYPLNGREVWHIAKSVAKWTWRNFDIDASDARFSKLQAFRGTKNAPEIQASKGKLGGLSNNPETQAAKGQLGGINSGLARLEASADQRVSAKLLHAQGMSIRAIAAELGIPKSTVSRWLS